MTSPASTSRASLWRSFLDLVTSLQLTIVLLAFGMVLVFGATLDQTNLGIWGIQQKWFHTFLVHMDFRGLALPVFPGGYLIGGLLLGNLVAALAFRFAWSWKKAGLIVSHIGLILLLLGELLSGLWQQEYRLRLSKGESKDFVENLRDIELAIVDSSAPTFDQVVAIPTSQLESHRILQHRDLPFNVSTLAFYPNAVLSPGVSGPGAVDGSTKLEGLAQNVSAAPQPITYRPDEENAPAAYVAFTPPGGTAVTVLVSTLFAAPQDIRVGDKTYQVALRSARHYMPFKLRLLEFTHEKYAGTDIPKGFSSRVQILPSNGEAAREVNIYMNHPLRHGGLTFYQAGFENNDRTTILQVVSNPSWQLPYVSCSLIALGLLVHFTASLVRFRSRTAAPARQTPHHAPAAKHSNGSKGAFYLTFGAVLLATLLAFLPGKDDPFGRLPVLVNGRIKPMDTVARSGLLLIQGRQSVKTTDGKRLTPSVWLLDMFFRPVLADSYPVFEITNNDVLSLLSLAPEDGQGGKRFAYTQFSAHLSDLERQAKLAEDVPSGERSTFQRHLLNLREAVALYQHLHYTFLAPGVPNLLQALSVPQNATGRSELVTIGTSMESMSPLHPLPSSGNGTAADWSTFASAVGATGRNEKLSPAATDYLALGLAWQKQDLSAFQEAVSRRSHAVSVELPNQDLRTRVETAFNASAPFYLSMLLYVGAFLIALFSWLRWPATLGRLAYAITALAWVLTTLGILCRMWLENRPPVTNLYSSALFVGWGSVGLCLYLEKIHRNGIGSAAAGLTGFATLLIAHHLSLSGDTMEMMRAVLDSNFWLATHVVTVTVGYSATFLAGFLGLFYLGRGLFTRSLDKASADATLKMIVGIVAFATFFSFVGTVLGGIWADQSWGRFWGWDPKENGALLIVMWNAIVLHARWGGYVKARGIVALVIFGNIVTAWSWFGVNMLGVGLHSYGFMDSAMWWLVGFAGLQALAMVLAGLPLSKWRSATLWKTSAKSADLVSENA